jgi:hypothetical protein
MMNVLKRGVFGLVLALGLLAAGTSEAGLYCNSYYGGCNQSWTYNSNNGCVDMNALTLCTPISGKYNYCPVGWVPGACP